MTVPSFMTLAKPSPESLPNPVHPDLHPWQRDTRESLERPRRDQHVFVTDTGLLTVFDFTRRGIVDVMVVELDASCRALAKQIWDHGRFTESHAVRRFRCRRRMWVLSDINLGALP